VDTVKTSKIWKTFQVQLHNIAVQSMLERSGPDKRQLEIGFDPTLLGSYLHQKHSENIR